MLKRIYTSLFLLITLISCSGDDDDVFAPVILDGANTISSFELTINNEIFKGIIDQKEKTITFDVVGANLNSLVPKIEYSSKATISPKQDIPQNFGKQVAYTIYAENGDPSVYRVIVNNRPLSNENKIIDFSFTINDEVINATVNEELKEIEFDVVSVDLGKIVPEIKVSQYASITSGLDTAPDFNEIVYYTVKAENGYESKYKVIANRPKIEVVKARYFASRFVYANAELRVSGKFVNPNVENVKLYLTDGLNKYPLQILSSDSYENDNKINYYLDVRMPSEIPTNSDYKVVYSTDKFIAESEELIDVLAENIPKVISLNKEFYGVDDFVVITGTNLTEQLAIPNDGSLYLVEGNFTSIYSYEINTEKTEVKFQLIRQVYGWGGPVERTITLLGSGRRVGPTITTRFGS